MVKGLKKSATRVISLLVAALMVFSLLPISRLVFADTGEKAVKITVLDEKGQPITGAKVNFSIFSANNDANVVEETDVEVDENGSVAVMTKTVFDTYSVGDLTLNATASASAYVPDETEGTVENQIIPDGEYVFTIKLKPKTIPDVGVTATTDADKLVYDGTNKDLVTISAKAGDTVEVLVNDEAEDLGITMPLAEDKNDIVIQRKDADDYEVKVTIKRDGFANYTDEKTVTVTEATLTSDLFDFDAIDGLKFNHKVTSQQLVTITKGEILSTDDVTWQVGTESTNDHSLPAKYAVGEYAITLTLKRANYQQYSKSVTATINNGEINLDGLTISANDLTYTGEAQAALSVSGQSASDYDLRYSLTEEGIASGALNTIPEVTDAGDYTFFVRAEKEGYNNKKYETYPIAVTVKKADITEEITVTPYTGTYDADNHDAIVSVSGQLSGDTVTYSKDDVSYASDIPQVKKVADSGIYYVKIHRNDNYNDKIVSGTVVIDKATPAIAFPDEVTVAEGDPTPTVYYGENNSFTYAILPASVSDSEGEITYAIVAEDTTANATINNGNGEVTFTSVGHIKVTASIASDDNYLSASKSYEIDVVYEATPAYSLTAAQYVENQSGSFYRNWYNCPVEISATGWEVIKDSNAIGQTGWLTDIKEETEGDYNNYKIAFRNTTTNNITELVNIDRFAIDTTKPTDKNAIDVQFAVENTDLVSKVIHNLTFGLFCNQKMVATVTCDDEAKTVGAPNVGIKSIQLTKYNASGDSLGTEEHLATEANFNKFTLPMDFEGTVKVEVIDYLDNSLGQQLITTANSNMDDANTSGYIMIEETAPTLSDLADAPTSGVRKQEGTKNYSGDAQVTFSAQDSGSGLYAVEVTVNGNDYSVTPNSFATQDREQHDYTLSTEGIDATADGAYHFVVTVTDNAGNVTSKETTLYIDRTSPVITGFDFGKTAEEVVNVTDYGYFFKDDAAVTVTAADNKADNENATGVKSITVVLKDVAENKYYTIDGDGKMAEIAEADIATAAVAHNTTNTFAFTVEAKFKGHIYAFATDNAGNTPLNSAFAYQDAANDPLPEIVQDGALKGYKQPNGSVLEKQAHHDAETDHIVISLPETTKTQSNGTTPLYDNDVDISVAVKDSFAGIREITWSVTSANDTEQNYSGKLTVAKNGTTFTCDEGSKEDDWQIDTKEINLATLLSNTIKVKNNSTDITVAVTLTDRAGNTSSDSKVFGIDKTKPVVSNIALSNTEWTNQSVTFTVTASDENGSGIKGYRVDNGDWQLTAENTNANQFSFANNAEHTFEAIDYAGNVSVVTDASKKAADHFEDVKPVISDVSLSETEATNQAITFTVAATDEEGGSGIKGYRVDNGAWQLTAENENANQFVCENNLEHEFEVIDNAGNISIVFKKTATNYDAKKPDLNGVTFTLTNTDVFHTVLNFLTFGNFFNQDEKVVIDAVDVADDTSSASGIKEYTVSFKDVNDITVKEVTQTESATFEFAYSEIANFKGSLYLKITDNAGNIRETQITAENSNLTETTFMIENTESVITVTPQNTYYKTPSPDDKLIYNADFKVNYVVDDQEDGKEVSGVNYIYVKVNDTTVYTLDNGDGNEDVKQDLYNFDLQVNIANKKVNGVNIADWKNGVLTFEAYAVDNAGNVAETKTTTYYIDQTSPVITKFDFGKDVEDVAQITDYGYYFKTDASVTVSASDPVGTNETVASAVKSITVVLYDAVDEKYYTIDGEGNMVEIAEADIATAAVAHETADDFTFTVKANFKGQIYAFATDYLNNTPVNSKFAYKDVTEDPIPEIVQDGALKGYKHPNGSILETEDHHNAETGHIAISMPEAPTTRNSDNLPFYKNAINIGVTVKDAYAGIREITWKVSSAKNTDNNYQGTLTVANDGTTIAYTGDAAENDWQIDTKDVNLATVISNTINVDIESDDVTVEITMFDRAGNKSEDSKVFGIDKTAPTLESVTFEQENNGILATTLNFLSFGVFFNEKLEVTVAANDKSPKDIDGVGIAGYKIFFYDGNDATVYESSDWQTSNKFTITDVDVLKNFKGKVSVAITDKLDWNKKYLADTNNSNLTETTFMIENTKSVITVTPQNTYYKTPSPDDKLIYNADFKVNYVVDDQEDGKEVSGVNYIYVKVNDTTVYTLDNGDGNEDVKQDLYNFDLQVDIANKKVNNVDITDWENGVLTFEAYTVDNAGNAAEIKTDTYYIDQTSPVITKFDFGKDVESVVDITDYGYYFKDDVQVTVTAEDKIDTSIEAIASGVQSITVVLHDVVENQYYTIDNEGKMYAINEADIATEANLPHATDKDFTFTVKTNFKGQIYAFATDNLGNMPTNSFFQYTEHVGDQDIAIPEIVQDGTLKGYKQPNGSVLEDVERHANTSAIEIVPAPADGTIEDTQNNAYAYPYDGNAVQKDAVAAYNDEQKVPLYNKGISFVLTVRDDYSGIREIKTTIKEYGDNEPKELLTETVTVGNVKDGSTRYDVNDTIDGWTVTAVDQNLVTTLTKTISVDDNYNNMVLLVELTDRAGNTSYDYYVFGIDETKPEIDLSYGAETHDDQYKDYFRTDRTATVTITERNFRAKDVEFKFTNTDGWTPGINLQSEKAWKTVEDTQNPDNTKHIATFTYNHDGDYTFKIDYQDNVKNRAKKSQHDEFTIDKTKPTIKVSYDLNLSDGYYNQTRVATINIKEHNFDASRVKIIGTADETSFPKLSSWSNSGDNHVATITYSQDSKYTFDIEFVDKAGNKADDYAKDTFTVDKTSPALEIRGVKDQSANKGATIGFTMTATDTNFGTFEPVVTAVTYKDGRFETNQITPGNITSVANGQQYTVQNISTDGIYKITCKLVDLAGNAFDEKAVILKDENGVTYTKAREDDSVLLIFSVNRNGSTFYVEGYTEETLKDYYRQNITENIVIHEINPDVLTENKVTVNDAGLDDKKDYSVSEDASEGTWHKYSYSIQKSVFKGEGEYNIIVYSKDKAENKAYSDIKDLSVKFVVDRTAPIVNVSGIKTNGRYRTDKKTVKVIPSDDGGQLKKLTVKIFDSKGNETSAPIKLEGKELLKAVEADNISFEIGEGLYQDVRIVCEDAAGNITGEDKSGELYGNISVSTNSFLIFWANKAARYAVIAGISVLAIGSVAFVVFRKKQNS